MSGHSKWHNIKRKKEATDAKKASAFTKLSAEIASAIRQNGPSPDANPALRDAIDRAKKAGFPQTNIDRLIQKGSAASQHQVTYEAFGPGGAALIILASTDNPNRTVAEIRTILKDHGGSLGQPHSVMWKFDHQPNTEEFTPKFQTPLDDAARVALAALLEETQNHPDVEKVFTDAPTLS